MEAMALLTADDDQLPMQDHDDVQALAASTPRLALNAVERRAITELVSDPSGTVITNTRDRATGLAGADRHGVRLRSLARATAVAEATLQQMNLLLVTAIRTHDLETAKALSKLVDGANHRYCELTAQLSLEDDGARRHPVLFIAAANEVNVGDGGTPR
jgi:hypothetical protein